MKQKKSYFKWKTRIFSAMLAFAMAVALLPVKPGTVYAAGDALADTPQTYANARPSAPRPTGNNTDWKTGGTVDLAWSYNSSESITKCEVSRKAASGSFTTIAEVPVDSTGSVGNYADTDLPPGTYTYRYRSYNSYGWSDYSVDWPVTISNGRPSAPSPTGIATDSASNPGSITVMWNHSATENITKFEVSRKKGTNGSFTVVGTTGVGSSVGSGYSTYTDTGLSAGSYTYRIRAYNSGGWSDYSRDWPVTISNSRPDSPTVTGGPDGAGTINVMWTIGAACNSYGITEYEISRAKSGGTYTTVTTVSATAESVMKYADTGLAAGTYTYRVRAKNTGGWSEYGSQTYTLTSGATAPAAPSITVTAGLGRNTVSWSAPANNGSPITKYEISRKTGTGTYTVLSSTYTGTTYNDSSVTNGTSYTYRVRAYNAIGWSGYSAEKSGTPYAVPSAPSAPSVTPGDRQNVIKWTAPANNGSTITKYELKRGNTVIKSDITGTSYTDTNLTNGTNYSYTVRAYNAAGWGNFSSAGSGTPRAVPGIPTLSASPGNGTVTLSWTAPANNGSAIKQYEISRNGSPVTTPNALGYTDTGLTNGTAYTYTVRAQNAAGYGSYSMEVVAVPRTVPSAPSAPSVTPGNGQVVITWTAPANNGATITSYEVYQDGTYIGTTTSTTLTKTGLTNGTAYTYTVRAYNAAGWGNQSAGTKATPRTVPNAPSTPQVTPGVGKNTIYWTAPANNGAAITKYEVSRKTGSGAYAVVNANVTDTSYTDPSLTAGTAYTYRIRAYNAAGWSGYSPEKAGTPFTTPSAPGAPSVAPGNGQNVITWTAPATGGSAITKYELKRGSTVLKSDITGTSYTDTGLANGTSYSYTVRAYNAAGWGSFSSAGSGTPRTVPAAPAITVTAGNKQNVISWSAPANNGASITKYEVSRKTGSGAYAVVNANVTGTSYTDSSLTAGTAYTYKVRAYNAAGWGGYSAEKGATPYTVPNTPGAPVVSPGNGQNVITWSAPANGGNAITKYELKRGSTVVKSDITGTSYTDTGLANGTSYSYTVRAYNAAGWGSFSSAGSGTPRTVPAAPAITVTAGNKQNVISWSAPANNGASITKYEVSRKTGSGAYAVVNANVTGTSYTDSSLTAGTAYTYKVRAYNAAGWGGYSAEKGATPYTVPNAPGAPVVSPGNGQNVITWTAPANGGNAIDSYEVFQNGISIGTTATTSMNKTGLSNGTEYTYTVKAHNTAGWSAASAGTKATPYTIPAAPGAPVVAPGNGQNVISWTAPANNGSAIDNYEVFQNNVSIGTTKSTTLTKTGLTNGTAYTYTVKAHNAAGWSAASAGTAGTPRNLPNKPAAPTVTLGDKQVTIYWAAPAANGASITNYEVFQNGVSIGTTTSLSMNKTGLVNQTGK